MGSALSDFGSYLSRELSHIENIVLILVAIIIFLLKIVISIRGTNTPWFKQVQSKEFINTTTAGVSWTVAYLISIVGIIYLTQQGQGFKSQYLSGLYLLGLIFSLLWDVIFYYGRDIKFSLIVYLFLTIYYAWFFYEIFQVSVIGAFFQLFLLIRTIYFFIQIGLLLINNPSDTIIPF